MEQIQGTKKEFLDGFRELCYSRNSWQVWADLVSTMACSLANATDKTEPRFSNREREYAECIKRLGGVELPAKLFAVVTMALEHNPNQDFLGELYMELNLGNHWKGQFFTPHSVAMCMAEINIGDDFVEKAKNEPFISVCDPACGAGVTLIAAANVMRIRKINYQTKVLFVGQDVDRVVGQMCYIQLSLLGCSGYIVIANTLTNPLRGGSVLMPYEAEGQEFWYTPMFNSNIWMWRKLLHSMGMSESLAPKEKIVKKENFFMFFDFEKENVQ